MVEQVIARQVRAVQALNTVVNHGDKVVVLSPPGYFRISLTATDEIGGTVVAGLRSRHRTSQVRSRASRSARVIPHVGHQSLIPRRGA